MAGAFGDERNYVGQDASGWHAYVNGVEVGGGPFATQAQAEQAYNANQGPGSGQPTPGAGTGSGPTDPISSEHRNGLRTAGYGDWNNPNLTEADFARISGGAASAAGKGTGTNPFPGFEFQDPTALEFLKTAIQQAYNKALLQQGDRALAEKAAYEQAQIGLQALGLIGQFRGPRNAFQYESVLHGLNASGVGKSIDALAGRTTLPTFQANQAAPQPVTLATVRADMKNAGPSFGSSPMSDVVSKIFGQIGLGSDSASGYATKNGTKTLDQMLGELKNAQWGPAQGTTRPSDADIIAAYAHTTGAAVTPPGTGSANPPAMGNDPTAGWGDFWTKVPGFAGGTNGPLPYDVNAMVGENGPEMAHLPRGSNIVPLFGSVGDTGGVGGRAPVGTAPPAAPPPALPGGGDTGGVGGAPPVGDPGGVGPIDPHLPNAPADAWLKQFPDPTQISIREWSKLDQDTQQLILSGYAALGYSEQSILDRIQRLRPDWTAPRFGSLVA